ncbi:MAG: DUF6131 family protein [Candidatus Sericytochromatia bacterium]
MIIAGVILLLLGYLVPWPASVAFLATICIVLGWILLVVGIIFLILGLVGRPVARRRYWY